MSDPTPQDHEQPQFFPITRALWAGFRMPVPRGDKLHVLSLWLLAIFAPLMFGIDVLFAIVDTPYHLVRLVKRVARRKPHVPMGVHAAHWCATCSHDDVWVNWPCEFANAQEIADAR